MWITGLIEALCAPRLRKKNEDKKYGHNILMGSLLCVATNLEIRIINSETGTKCMAKYDNIFKRKKR